MSRVRGLEAFSDRCIRWLSVLLLSTGVMMHKTQLSSKHVGSSSVGLRFSDLGLEKIIHSLVLDRRHVHAEFPSCGNHFTHAQHEVSTVRALVSLMTIRTRKTRVLQEAESQTCWSPQLMMMMTTTMMISHRFLNESMSVILSRSILEELCFGSMHHHEAEQDFCILNMSHQKPFSPSIFSFTFTLRTQKRTCHE